MVNLLHSKSNILKFRGLDHLKLKVLQVVQYLNEVLKTELNTVWFKLFQIVPF